MNKDYSDIINLPHHVSEKRPHMSMADRAAQFSPFAALTGYDAAVKETARLTEQRVELDEDEQRKVSERLSLLQSCLGEFPEVEITYFIPDMKKTGGKYSTVTGTVRKLDEYHRTLILLDGTRIPIDEIVDVDGAMFHSMDDSFS
ncbi:MAG: YolD-like family protein [Clostridiales bacterium]|nr:YolD-like family protein [Clostridiales bacterium]